jgi:hypothetical protein
MQRGCDRWNIASPIKEKKNAYILIRNPRFEDLVIDW